MLAVWARATARAEGALTAATVGKPAAQAFWRISKEARPLTKRHWSEAGRLSSRSILPTTLSTALWRPMSSRTISGSPFRLQAAAAWTPPVFSKRACRGRTFSGMAARTSGGNLFGFSSGLRCSNSCWMLSAPQIPQDEVAVPSLGVGSGTSPAVSTVTMLNSVSVAGASAQ